MQAEQEGKDTHRGSFAKKYAVVRAFVSKAMNCLSDADPNPWLMPKVLLVDYAHNTQGSTHTQKNTGETST